MLTWQQGMNRVFSLFDVYWEQKKKTFYTFGKTFFLVKFKSLFAKLVTSHDKYRSRNEDFHNVQSTICIYYIDKNIVGILLRTKYYYF